MTFFSYVLVFAFVLFLLYGVITVVRFAFVRIKAYVIRRKLAKVADSEKKRVSEKKDD